MATQLLDIALRSAAMYIVILLGLRLLGKSHLAQLSMPDFVFVLLISNAVQNAMVGNDSSLIGGIVAASTLLLLNYLLTLLQFRFRRANVLIGGTPTLLIHEGEVIREHLEHEKITVDELTRVIREHGIEQISDVKNAVMEVDGTISVIPRGDQEKRIETFKHHRTKYQQRKI